MDFVKRGQTGLDVSRLCLGCMTFGDPDAGAHPWTLGEDDSRPTIKRAVELGINFFDTANSYSAGTSERIVGKLLGKFTQRDEVVIATKMFFPEGALEAAAGPNRKGLSPRRRAWRGVARDNGWTRFVSMQNYVNLLYREEEREMIPLCRDQGVGLMPWSPIAPGRSASRPNAARAMGMGSHSTQRRQTWTTR